MVVEAGDEEYLLWGILSVCFFISVFGFLYMRLKDFFFLKKRGSTYIITGGILILADL